MHESTMPSDRLKDIADDIAGMALREAAFFDRLWAARNPTSGTPTVRRRHKQFVSEFVTYYCCVCDHYFDSRDNAFADSVVDEVVEEVVAGSIRDSFLEPPLFRGDMPGARKDRYRRDIAQRRSLFKASPLFGDGSLTFRTAEALANVISDEAAKRDETRALQSVISHRLEWTARELTG